MVTQHAELLRSFCTSGMQTDAIYQVLLPVYIEDIASLHTLNVAESVLQGFKDNQNWRKKSFC